MTPPLHFVLNSAASASASASKPPPSDAGMVTGLLAEAAAPPPPPLGWPAVGVWNDSLPDLPQSSGGNLPHSPMLGNGYLGAMIGTNRVGAPLILK